MIENFKEFHVDLVVDDCYGFREKQVSELKEYISKLNTVFKKDVKNFVDLCVYVYKIKQLFDSYYSAWVYDSKRNLLRFDDIMRNFGIEHSQSSRLCLCFEKYLYLENEVYKIIPEFSSFSKSKLFELLPVDKDVLLQDIENNYLNSDMSVQQLRSYVKNFNAKKLLKQKALANEDENQQEDKPADFDESSIPMAYIPSQEYEFSYFESKTKSQLLNMIWELQKEFQKLLKKEKNKK